VPPRHVETLRELAPRAPLAFRLPSNGIAQPGPTPIEPPRDETVAPPESWTLELTPAERQYLERALTALTTREREVVFAICAGGTNELLADRLCIALPTIRTHLMRLNQKLGTTSKGDVVRFITSKLLDGYRSREIAAITA
jgi:DNA-binding CsgD family transcriptional regulator